MDPTSKNPSHEQTFVMIKPDGVARGLIGEVIQRLERKGLRILCMELGSWPKDKFLRHYGHLKDKPYFAPLVNSSLAGPSVIMCVSGLHAVQTVRYMIGATAGFEASAGTIRGDFSNSQRLNIVHASDSLESAKFELGLWFGNSMTEQARIESDLSVDYDRNYTPEENAGS